MVKLTWWGVWLVCSRGEWYEEEREKATKGTDVKHNKNLSRARKLLSYRLWKCEVFGRLVSCVVQNYILPLTSKKQSKVWRSYVEIIFVAFGFEENSGIFESIESSFLKNLRILSQKKISTF